MDKRAAHRAINAFWVLSPKSTMLLIVEATELLICVMMKTPRKLKKALMRMAFLALKQRVVTQVAMALGASVHPFTKITPRVKMVVTRRAGFPRVSLRKPRNDKSISCFLSCFSVPFSARYTKRYGPQAMKAPGLYLFINYDIGKRYVCSSGRHSFSSNDNVKSM